MKNNYLKTILLVLALVFFFALKSSAEPEIKRTTELKNKKDEELSNVVWNEGLRFKDFSLNVDTVHLLENMNLSPYLKDLEKQYKTNPKAFSIAINYGLLLIDIGELDKAEKIFNTAINDFKGNPTPNIYRAWILAEKGDYKSAKDIWYEHLKGKGTARETLWIAYDIDAATGLNLIQNELEEKDKKEVKELLDFINPRFKFRPKIAAVLAVNDLNSGRIVSAKERAEEVLTRYPNEYLAKAIVGIADLIQGNNEQSIKSLDTSYEQFPFSSTVNLMRARAYFALDKKKESKLAYKKALELDPKLESKSVKKNYLLETRSYLSSLNVTAKTDDVKN